MMSEQGWMRLGSLLYLRVVQCGMAIGASIDHGEVNYDASSEIGTVGSNFVVNDTGAIVANGSPGLMGSSGR
jgi:hypothetical protein